MLILTYLAHALGCALLVNAIPHCVNGLSGQAFQSPFANPPGIGESSPVVNVLWGASNLLAGSLLLFKVGDFTLGINLDTALCAIVALSTAVALAKHFGKVRHQA